MIGMTVSLTMTKQILTHDFCAGVLDSLVIELKISNDFSKLYVGISILAYIASISDQLNARACSQLLFFLGHRYPKVCDAILISHNKLNYRPRIFVHIILFVK